LLCTVEQQQGDGRGRAGVRAVTDASYPPSDPAVLALARFVAGEVIVRSADAALDLDPLL
jgi:hypothetical protein